MSIARLLPIASSFARSGAVRQSAQTMAKQTGAFIQDFANTAATHHVVGPHVQNAAMSAIKQAGDSIGKAGRSLTGYTYENGLRLK